MRNLLRITLIVAIALGASLVAANVPKTLLGKWMTANISVASAGKDYPTLQKDLQLVADKPPPGSDFPKWSAMAQAGADAAKAEDSKGVSKCCKDCHAAYKETYIKAFPTRAFP
jgi:cytochrome c553